VGWRKVLAIMTRSSREWHVEVKARAKQLEWLGEDIRHHHFTAEWDAKILFAVFEQ
jgi:hypothetical protein